MKTNKTPYVIGSTCVNKIKFLKLRICCFILCMVILKPGLEAKSTGNDTISHWSILMAENLMNNPSIARGPALNEYVFSTALKDLRLLWEMSQDSVYFDYISGIVDENLSYYEGLNGEIYNMDYVNGASLILFLYSETGDSKYIPAIDSTLKYLNSFPRTSDGGILHKALNRLQLDDLYMIGPFMTEYGILFNKPEIYQDAVKQALLFKKYMCDKETGLMYHSWYDGSLGELEGCTPYFWGRGIGWVAMALVDMLDFLPESCSERDSIIEMFQDLAQAISSVQDTSSNVWWQIVDKPSEGNNYQESSASCMFVYSIARGIKLGYLDNSYLPVVKKGIQGIMDNFLEIVDDKTINVLEACPGQGPSFNLNAYFGSTAKNVHAVGPFIGANLEAAQLSVNPVVDIKRNEIHNNKFLLANYPNPFCETTTIFLNLPATEFIILDVYNIHGQLIERLYQGIKSAGGHYFTFNTSGDNSNIFICRFQSGNSVVLKKILRFK